MTVRGNVTTTTELGRTTNYQYDMTGFVRKRTDTSDGLYETFTPAANNTAVANATPSTRTDLTTSLAYTEFLAPQTITKPNGSQATNTYL